MKKLLVIVLISFCVLSCEQTNYTPVQWVDYYMFITNEDSDLFNAYPDYDASKVTMGSLYESRGYDFLDTVNTVLRFGWAAWRGVENYIDYGNGDIDTLTFSWEPQDITFEEAFKDKFKAADKITIAFNGIPVAVWDFIADPGLRNEIPARNNPFSARNTTLGYQAIKPDYDPIVIVLPKNPDWDEVN